WNTVLAARAAVRHAHVASLLGGDVAALAWRPRDGSSSGRSRYAVARTRGDARVVGRSTRCSSERAALGFLPRRRAHRPRLAASGDPPAGQRPLRADAGAVGTRARPRAGAHPPARLPRERPVRRRRGPALLPPADVVAWARPARRA